jgi:hypothetical protein
MVGAPVSTRPNSLGLIKAAKCTLRRPPLSGEGLYLNNYYSVDRFRREANSKLQRLSGPGAAGYRIHRIECVMARVELRVSDLFY